MTKKLNLKKIIKHWKDSSYRNYNTAKFLLKGKQYADCLFFCHLMLEKILKGLIVQEIKTHAPYIHELDVLAKKTNLNFSEDQINQLKIISTFNIAARYDDFQCSFYKKCTKKYTEEYFNISKKIYLWLNKKYQKK